MAGKTNEATFIVAELSAAAPVPVKRFACFKRQWCPATASQRRIYLCLLSALRHTGQFAQSADWNVL